MELANSEPPWKPWELNPGVFPKEIGKSGQHADICAESRCPQRAEGDSPLELASGSAMDALMLCFLFCAIFYIKELQNVFICLVKTGLHWGGQPGGTMFAGQKQEEEPFYVTKWSCGGTLCGLAAWLAFGESPLVF